MNNPSYTFCSSANGDFKFNFTGVWDFAAARKVCDDALLKHFGSTWRNHSHQGYQATDESALRAKIADEIEAFAREYVYAPVPNEEARKAQGWAILQAAAHVRKGK